MHLINSPYLYKHQYWHTIIGYNLYSMLSKLKDACSAAAAPITQIHSDIRLSKNVFVRFVYCCLQICLLVVACLLLGRLLAQARNPFLIASTQELAVKYNSFSFFSLAKRIVKKYCLYLALGLNIAFIMIFSTCQLINQRKKQTGHGEEKQSKKGKICFILFFLLVFYLATICLLAKYLSQYAVPETVTTNFCRNLRKDHWRSKN